MARGPNAADAADKPAENETNTADAGGAAPPEGAGGSGAKPSEDKGEPADGEKQPAEAFADLLDRLKPQPIPGVPVQYLDPRLRAAANAGQGSGPYAALITRVDEDDATLVDLVVFIAHEQKFKTGVAPWSDGADAPGWRLLQPSTAPADHETDEA